MFLARVLAGRGTLSYRDSEYFLKPSKRDLLQFRVCCCWGPHDDVLKFLVVPKGEGFRQGGLLTPRWGVNATFQV